MGVHKTSAQSKSNPVKNRTMKVSLNVNTMCSKVAAMLICCLFFLVPNYCQADTCSVEDGLRLTGFTSALAGYVEICKNETWFRLLTDQSSWTHKNSVVVCRQLGYLDALWLFDKSSVVQPSARSSSYTTSVECIGSEQTLNNCIRNPQHSLMGQQVYFVACREAPSTGDVRLVGISSSDSEGLVEMYFQHRGYRWSTLCTNDWDDMEAAVVCKQLGYLTGKSKHYSSWDVNIDQFPRQRYDKFKCNGTETSLSQCLSEGPYPYKCYSEGYAGVICQNYDINDTNRFHVPPTAAFLVLVTGILLLVIVILALVVKCATKLKRKEPPRSTDQDLDGSLHMHHMVNRVRLNAHNWNHTSTVGYSSLSNPAPPSYTDTIRADQETQHQMSQQTTSFLNNTEQSNEQSSEESATNSEEQRE